MPLAQMEDLLCCSLLPTLVWEVEDWDLHKLKNVPFCSRYTGKAFWLQAVLKGSGAWVAYTIKFPWATFETWQHNSFISISSFFIHTCSGWTQVVRVVFMEWGAFLHYGHYDLQGTSHCILMPVLLHRVIMIWMAHPHTWDEAWDGIGDLRAPIISGWIES